MKYRGDFEYVPFPEFVKSWESFAGKYYVKPGKNTGLRTRKTGVIAGTVKDAQELLCGLAKTVDKWVIRDYWARSEWTEIHQGADIFYLWKPVQFPQSLGELCIELAQDDILYERGWERGVIDVPKFAGRLSRDIQNLRTLMYYKRKNHYIRDGFYDNTEYFQDQIDSQIAGGTQ